MTINQSLADRAEYEAELDARMCEGIMAADPFQETHTLLSLAAHYVRVRILDVPASELETIPTMVRA
jgi:hypothetical protein